ncbi:hypothetical protein EMIT0P294_10392 [Pseudomonas sp. IT-P294]
MATSLQAITKKALREQGFVKKSGSDHALSLPRRLVVGVVECSSSITDATSVAIASVGKGPIFSPVALCSHHWPSFALLIKYPLTLFASDIYLPRWLVQLRNDSAKCTQTVLMGVWWFD